MKRVLCFGDSNTFGHNPVDGTRLPYDQRWTGILAGLLGADWQVIEEGLCGRTTTMDDPSGYGLNGLTYLEPCLLSHFPLDLVIIMLGTNDLQVVHPCIPATVALSVRRVVARAKEVIRSGGGKTKVLLISPIYIGDTSVNEYFKELFPVGLSDVRSRQLAPLFQQVAQMENCLFLDAAKVAKASAIDGLHMDPENHKKLAQAIAEMIHRETA